MSAASWRQGRARRRAALLPTEPGRLLHMGVMASTTGVQRAVRLRCCRRLLAAACWDEQEPSGGWGLGSARAWRLPGLNITFGYVKRLDGTGWRRVLRPVMCV